MRSRQADVVKQRMPPDVTGQRARVDQLLAGSRKGLRAEERSELLRELVELYHEIKDVDGEAARATRREFLLSLTDTPEILTDEHLSSFLAEHIEPEDFTEVKWESPAAVVKYCDMLNSFRFRDDDMAERVRLLESALLRDALQRYEQQGQYEKMLRLLRQTPTSPAMTDIELRRLRNRAYLYEMGRVQRHRRWLYGYLILQAFLIFVVFPLLFVNAENGAIQREIEAAAQVDLPEERTRAFSYWDGLYWSLITAASIGYGDITPETSVGRMIAATLGMMGVLTIGVTAGLILDLISPRSID